jgi:Tat protein secretion system quality control protein TatD with DNase activity
MWTDSHAHLDRLPEKELSVVLAESAAAGVSTVLSTATDLTSAATVIIQCRTFPGIYGAVGISPFETRGLPVDWQNRLHSFCCTSPWVRSGLIGQIPHIPTSAVRCLSLSGSSNSPRRCAFPW